MSYYSLVKIFSNDPYCLTKVLFLLEGSSFFVSLLIFIFLSFVYFFLSFWNSAVFKKNWISFDFLFFFHPFSTLWFLSFDFLDLFFLNSFSLPLLSLDFWITISLHFCIKKTFQFIPFTMLRYLCPPCVHPFVHLLSLLSLSLSRFLFSIAFDFLVFLLLSLSVTFFLTCFWDFCNFLSVYLFVGIFLHIYVFLPVCHFFPFFNSFHCCFYSLVFWNILLFCFFSWTFVFPLCFSF